MTAKKRPPRTLPKAMVNPETMIRGRRFASELISGMTLQEIGNREGVTRERIRQIVVAAGLDQEVKDVRAALIEHADSANARRVAAITKFTAKKKNRRDTTQYTDDQIINAVRKWLNDGGDGNNTTWLAEGRSPSLALIATRIGWANAIIAAGGVPKRIHPNRRSDYTTVEECLLSVVDFLCDTTVKNGSIYEYREWQTLHPDAIGDQTIRHRLGSWVEAKQAALDAISPMSITDLDWDLAEERLRELTMEQFRAERRAEFFAECDAKWAKWATPIAPPPEKPVAVTVEPELHPVVVVNPEEKFRRLMERIQEIAALNGDADWQPPVAPVVVEEPALEEVPEEPEVVEEVVPAEPEVQLSKDVFVLVADPEDEDDASINEEDRQDSFAALMERMRILNDMAG